MDIDPIMAVIIIVLVVAALACAGLAIRRRAKGGGAQGASPAQEVPDPPEQDEAEARDGEGTAPDEAAEALEEARRQMALAQQHMHEAQQDFQARHDELVSSIYQLAKAGCDARFQQRFGVTRPTRAKQPEDDPEVQEYLRTHYAQLRDAALEEATESLMQREADRRQLRDGADGEHADACRPEGDAQDAVPPEAETPAAEAESADSGDGAATTETEPQAEPAAEDASEPAPQPQAPASDEAEGSDSGDSAAEPIRPPEEDESQRQAILDAVRREFDVESARIYLLAAISARYDADGKPIGNLPWPAYTTFSPRGYGELVLAEGAPVYAQDSYRDFAWKRFHTGRRDEKPDRGEYSWPASHGLGDGLVIYELATPAGTFTAAGPDGSLPLCEWIGCAWMRRSLEYQGALLKPDAQRSFFVNLEGLHKGDAIELSFDGPEFLEEAPDGPFYLNATGPVGEGGYLGISASRPEAASPGDAPYALERRDARGFSYRMMQDARRYDADTYPQFIEVHIAWSQPPAPKPERIVRHVAR